jgi:hypothetical protein
VSEMAGFDVSPCVLAAWAAQHAPKATAADIALVGSMLGIQLPADHKAFVSQL